MKSFEQIMVRNRPGVKRVLGGRFVDEPGPGYVILSLSCGHEYAMSRYEYATMRGSPDGWLISCAKCNLSEEIE